MNKPVASDVVWNVPNVLSMIRLVLSVGVFALIPAGYCWSAMIVFLVAAGTDWIDGWWARRYNQVTKLGRVLDPFCDKILICGTFILLAVELKPAVTAGEIPWYAAIAGWIAVVVVGRELLVTALRSAIEGAGGDFSAKMAGKLKMVFQCASAVAGLVILIYLANAGLRHPKGVEFARELGFPPVPAWLIIVATIANGATVISTLWSGWGYLLAAAPGMGLGSRPAK